MKDKLKEHIEIDLNFIQNYFEEYKLNVTDFLSLYSEYDGAEEFMQFIGEETLTMPESEAKNFRAQMQLAKNHFEKVSSIVTPQLNFLIRQEAKPRAEELLNDTLKNDLAIKGAFESVLTYTKAAPKKQRKQVLGE